MSIYVPDSLKSRMDPLADRVNWSSVAQEAFEAEIRLNPKWEENGMTAVIERLRASKQKHMKSRTDDGFRDGKLWAERDADFACLKSLVESELDAMDPDDIMLELIPGLVDEPHAEDFWESVSGDQWRQIVNGWYMIGFYRGAKAVWKRSRISSNLRSGPASSDAGHLQF